MSVASTVLDLVTCIRCFPEFNATEDARILLLSDRLIVVRTIEGVKIPKVKQSRQSFLRQLVTEFGDSVFTTDGSVLFCKLCEVKVSAEKRFTATYQARKTLKGYCQRLLEVQA